MQRHRVRNPVWYSDTKRQKKERTVSCSNLRPVKQEPPSARAQMIAHTHNTFLHTLTWTHTHEPRTRVCLVLTHCWTASCVNVTQRVAAQTQRIAPFTAVFTAVWNTEQTLWVFSNVFVYIIISFHLEYTLKYWRNSSMTSHVSLVYQETFISLCLHIFSPELSVVSCDESKEKSEPILVLNSEIQSYYGLMDHIKTF